MAGVTLLLFAVFSLVVIEASGMWLSAASIPEMWGGAVWVIGGMVMGALLFPGVLRTLRRNGTNKDKDHSRAIIATVVACLLTSTLFAYGTEVTSLFSAKVEVPHVRNFIRGLFLAMGLLLFFGIIPGHMQGRVLGGLFAVMEALRFLLAPVFTEVIANGGDPSSLLQNLDAVRLGMMGVVVVLSLLVLTLWRNGAWQAGGQKEEDPGQAALHNGFLPQAPAYRLAFPASIALAMAALCFTQNGYLNGILFYTLRFYPVPIWLHLVLAFLFIVAGGCIDKFGGKAMRILISISACSFLLLPALLVTSPEGMVHTAVRYLIMFTLPAFFFTMSLLLGRGPLEKGFPGLMCIAVYIMFFAAFYGFAFDFDGLDDEFFILGTLLSAAIMLLLFFSLSRQISGQPSNARKAGEKVLPESMDGSETMPLEEFVKVHGISPRKRELLSLLVNGANTKTIAASMGIAEYTVRLHIHQILRKVGVPNRKCLVHLIRPEC